MIFNLAPQGSEIWLAARRGRITGSRFKDARARLADKTDKKTGEITRGLPSQKCLSYAHDVARERVGGKPAEVYVNGAMRLGTEQEPFARLAYETVTGHLVQEVGFATTECGTFGLSLDGKIGDKGAVEIKTMVSSETLFSAVVDGDISEYEDQCHGAILFLGLDWIDLVLWTPDLEDQGLGLVIKRIERDETKLAALKADLDAFAALVSEFEGQLRSKAAANIKALNQTPVDQPTENPAMTQKTEILIIESGIVDEEAADLAPATHTEAAKLVTHQAAVEIVMPATPVPMKSIAPASEICEIVQLDTFSKPPPELRLGQMADRLGFSLTAAFLSELGFEPAATERASKLYHESDFPRICAALVARIHSACQLQSA